MNEEIHIAWPGGRDPRITYHYDHPGEARHRWIDKTICNAKAVTMHTCHETWRLFHNEILTAAFILSFIMPMLKRPESLPGSAEPQLMYINFIVQAVILIVALVIAVAMAPKAPQPKPHALSDIDAPTAEEGKAYAKIFGECWVFDPNVIWYGDLESEPIRKKGGKK